MRSIPIDFFRIVLCLLIVDQHVFYYALAGNIGVVGFLAMAGYYMEKSFEHAGNQFDFRTFYKTKALNLLPEYGVGAMLGILAFLIGTAPFAHPDFARCPFSLATMAETFNYPCWFMACLFLFFAMAPVFFCLHQSKSGLYLAFAACFIYSAGLHVAVENTKAFYYASQHNILFFLAGMVAYRFWRQRMLDGAARLALSSLCALLLLSLIAAQKSKMTGLPEVIFSYSSCLVYMAFIPLLDKPSRITGAGQRATIYAASLTYAIYLFHVPVLNLYQNLPDRLGVENCLPGTHTGLIGLFLTCVAAALFAKAKKWVLNKLR